MIYYVIAFIAFAVGFVIGALLASTKIWKEFENGSRSKTKGKLSFFGD